MRLKVHSPRDGSFPGEDYQIQWGHYTGCTKRTACSEVLFISKGQEMEKHHDCLVLMEHLLQGN
jgi:hypothetical protein